MAERINEHMVNLIHQLDDAMVILRTGQRGDVEKSPGVTDNISRLGIARSALAAILEGDSFAIVLHADEFHEETIVRFDPKIPYSEMTWWRNFQTRVEKKQGWMFPTRNLPDRPVDDQGRPLKGGRNE